MMAHSYAMMSIQSAPLKLNGNRPTVSATEPVPIDTVNHDGVNCRRASRFLGSRERNPGGLVFLHRLLLQGAASRSNSFAILGQLSFPLTLLAIVSAQEPCSLRFRNCCAPRQIASEAD